MTNHYFLVKIKNGINRRVADAQNKTRIWPRMNTDNADQKSHY